MDGAMEVLRELGAVTAAGQATDLGKVLAGIPADPRLARALLDGSPTVGRKLAAETVALVSGEQRAPGGDLTQLLAAMRSSRSAPASRRFAEEARRLESMARQARTAVVRSDTPFNVTDAESPGYVVALAFPDRIARRVSPNSYLFSSGTRAGLPAGSPLAGHEWLAVAEVTRAQGRDSAGTGAVIRSAAPLSEALARAAAPNLVEELVEARFHQGRLSARLERRIGAIVVSSTPVRPSPEAGRDAIAKALARDGLAIIGWSETAETLRRRLALLRRELGEPWPDVSEPGLLARLGEWLAPELETLAGGKSLNSVDLAEPLRRLLPWPEAVHFDALVPEKLEVPSGSRVRILYPEVPEDGTNDGGRPVVAVKLQECFGWDSTPRLVDGRVPVLFHLLSPAGRPLAVTDDLASFWSGPYSQVRAEMRGRYPKHPWPEDPWTAPATARTKNRM
jgi:ATP-dependent helicase HrpB